MEPKFYFLVRATRKIRGPNAIRYENVATDSEFGQGLSEVRFGSRWTSPVPSIKYCFNGSVIKNIFLTTHPIKIVSSDFLAI